MLPILIGEDMKVNRICSLGYFDKVIVDGYMMPMYNNKGIEIKNDEKLVESIENNEQSYNQGIGKLKLNIYGEVTPNKSSIDEEKRMANTRTNIGLSSIKIGDKLRYSIGYADILILKSDYSFPENITNKGKTIDDIHKLAKGEDELYIMTQALNIQNNIIAEDNGIDDCNIAIIDRVYVNKEFRRCGISTWIHSNINDIAKIYGMIDIAAVLLIPGDFSNEADEAFNMSSKEYKEMLIKHYKTLGYKFIDKYVMCKYSCQRKTILKLR